MNNSTSVFTGNNQTAIWAIDPLVRRDDLFEKSAQAIEMWMRNFQPRTQILPTSVVAPEQLHWPEPLEGNWANHFRGELENKLRELLLASEIASEKNESLAQLQEHLLPPLILTQPRRSLRRSVAELIEAAKKQRAGLIVASTSVRPTLKRLTLGSFCESLLINSPLPTLTMHAGTKVPKQIHTIIFPTDLSDASKAQLPFALSLARATQGGSAKILLVHKAYLPAEVAVEPGFMTPAASSPAVDAFFQASQEQQENLLAQWRQEVETQGIECDAHFVTSNGGLADSLLNHIQQESDALVVMALQREPGLLSLLGHITQAIVREAVYPVLVLPAPETV